MRTNTKLFCEGTSPQLKRLTLKKRAGIKLTEREQQRLNESVSMVQIPKNRKSLVPQKVKPQPEDSIDLEEVLREMGYGEDDDLRAHPTHEIQEEDEVGSMSREELKQMIEDIVLSTLDEQEELHEIIENLTKR